MKKLSLYVFLGLMFCNIGFAEIKYKKVECEDEIFIDFIDNDKRAVLYRFFLKTHITFLQQFLKKYIHPYLSEHCQEKHLKGKKNI